MGCNTRHFDHDKFYASKTTRELEELLKESEIFVKEYPEFEYGWHNEYRQNLKMKIAERIGK